MTPADLVNNSMPTYRYHIVDRAGTPVEENIPTEDQAYTYLEFLKSQHPHEEYTVKQERIYTVKGMGRDPDLH